MSISEIKMEVTENSEGLLKLDDNKCVPDPPSEIGKYPVYVFVKKYKLSN